MAVMWGRSFAEFCVLRVKDINVVGELPANVIARLAGNTELDLRGTALKCVEESSRWETVLD